MDRTHKSSNGIDPLDPEQNEQVRERILRHPDAQEHLGKLRDDGIDLQNEHRGILAFMILAALSPAKKGRPSPVQRSRIRGLRSFPSRLASLAHELEDVFWRGTTRVDVVKGSAPKDFEILPTRMREAAQFLEGKLPLLAGRASSDREMYLHWARSFIRAYGKKHHDSELFHLMCIAQRIAGKIDEPPPDPEALRSRRYRERHPSPRTGRRRRPPEASRNT